ncbi:MAG TPA: tRNA uridine-5-carboxymethylaminomethyl(34) synthesis GTPase MnmE [Symbiobacteriaceae bacterium]
MNHLGDTIAAVATAPVEAGIGVVRISGPEALQVGDRAFRPRRGKPLSQRRSHTVSYGFVVDRFGQQVDEALALVMRGPHSYTGEDVVELQCHGGPVAVRKVLQVALEAGARLAEPGEFTRRAFLNGRLDLSQAEAVVEVVRAKTDRALEAAVRQLQGSLGQEIRAIRERLLEIAAQLEAEIDFPELDLETEGRDAVLAGCRWCLERIDGLLKGVRRGELLRSGVRVVLAGRPNVGKSSLLNRLVRKERAIVTAIPGTTRDVIEEWVNLEGVPVLYADTAGIRETTDEVERFGVDRSREMLQQADLVLWVVDGEAGLTPEDRAVRRWVPEGRRVIGVINKIDLVPPEQVQAVAASLGEEQVIAVSARSGEGIAELEQAVLREAGALDMEEGFVANERQAEALRRAANSLQAALETAALGFGPDLISVDIRAAWTTLGEITGETVHEELLDQIFSRFCIGK